MSNRRNFIKTAAIGSIGLSLSSFVSNKEQEEPMVFKGKINKPIVISTWNFGVQANGAAWEILKNNGRALDAVEAGVKIPEGDPTERSVGYGGRPDRDGRVTLDACIMDEFANIGFGTYQTSNFCCPCCDGKDSTCDVGWRWCSTVCLKSRFCKGKFIG